MGVYPRWSCERRQSAVQEDPDKFYADIHCQDIYHNFLVTVVSRINTITGVAYRYSRAATKHTEARARVNKP